MPALSAVVLQALSTSRLHLPASLRSPGVTRLHRYYGRSDSWSADAQRRVCPTGSPGLVMNPSDPSASNHPSSPGLPRLSFGQPGFTAWNRGLPPPPPSRGRWRHLDFALYQQARRDDRPNRVHLRCGRITPLRLLSTPPRGDAVTFGYGVPENPGKDLHLADSKPLQAH